MNYHSNQQKRLTELSETFSVTNVTKKETLTNPAEVDLAEETEDSEEEEDSNFEFRQQKTTQEIEVVFCCAYKMLLVCA